MPEEIKRVDYFSVPIANKVGEGARVLGALRDGGADFTGIWGYGISARKARIELMPKDSASFPKIAKAAGLDPGKKMTAFLIGGEDRPGVIAELLGKLAAAKVNVAAVKAICAGGGQFSGAIFVDPADVRRAAKALGV